MPTAVLSRSGASGQPLPLFRALMVSMVCGTSLVALAAGAPALAADIEAPSQITEVTVFPDAAQVSRVTAIDLPLGASTVVFNGLPAQLDPNSLRIQAGSEGQVAISSVVSSIAPAKNPVLPSSLAEKLRTLVNELTLLNETLRGLQAKKQMIERYSQASPEKLGDKAAPLNVSDWSKAWNAVGDGLAKVAEEIQAAQIRMREVQQEIQTLQASNREAAGGSRPSHVVRVDVDAASAGRVFMTLTYRVSGARWQPVYDARLESGGKAGTPSLELIRRASVIQRTGEDWSGVILTVSTVRAQRGTRAPDLLAQILDFYSPPPVPAPIPRAPVSAMGVLSRDRAERAIALNEGFAAKKMAKPAMEQEAVVDAGPFEARFRVPGKADLKADGSARVFRLATSKIVPEIVVRAAPALDTTAYLETVFVNKDAAPLLPGVVNLHRDGVYAGRGRVALIAPGEKVTLGFGADDSVKIKRVPVAKSQKGPGWIGNNRTEITDFTTSVTNLHAFAVNVRILDRIPVSENAEIVVSALPTNTKPQEERVDGKRGVVAWNFALKPQQIKDIRFGWQVQWPNAKRIVTRPSPN